MNSIKGFIASFLIQRYLKGKVRDESSFNNFMTNSQRIFVIYPQNDDAFTKAKSVLEFLLEKKKNVTVFIAEHKVNVLPYRNNLKVITHTLKDWSKLSLPTRSLKQQLENHYFDVVIDLNLDTILFFCAVANYINSKFRVGINKQSRDKFYNFQVPGQINSENSYRNLLNSLKMF